MHYSFRFLSILGIWLKRMDLKLFNHVVVIDNVGAVVFYGFNSFELLSHLQFSLNFLI
jgi:hypothetical protein